MSDVRPLDRIDLEARVKQMYEQVALAPESAASSTGPRSRRANGSRLGSGSGMDSILAANACGPAGSVIGVDMTEGQLAKATRLAGQAASPRSSFREGCIEDVPVEDGTVDRGCLCSRTAC